MGLFLVLFWCAAIAHRVHHHNSRFGVSNSRLGADIFPFSELGELGVKFLILLIRFGAVSALFGQNRQNSLFHGNNREFARGEPGGLRNLQ